MEIHLKNLKEIQDFFRHEVLDANQTRELLDINKQRLSQLVKQGRIVPIKEVPRNNLYLKQQVLVLKKELEAARKIYGTNK
ncbi:DNA-binding protein [Salmonella enterica subsp. enterica]|nr:DNA-binding protein [Salmonella enterica subsp. enterica serovar Paratyphi A]